MRFNRHYLLLFTYHFFYIFNYDWDFDNLFDYLLDVLVNSHDLRNNPFYFNNLGNLHKFFLDSLNLVYLRNGDSLLDNFFNDLLSSNYLLDFSFNRNEFFNDSWDLLNNFLNIRHNLFNFLDRFLNNNPFNYLFNLFDLGNFLDDWHYSLNYLWNRYNPLNYFLFRNHLLYYSVHWHRNLYRNNYLSLYLDGLQYLYCL